MGSLTDIKAKKAKPGRHGDGGGLYLLVSKAGSKSWMLRTIVQTASGPKRRDIGLGGYPLYSLVEAREKARELRKVARQGGDPIAARDKDRVAIPTFREAVTECHKAKADGWSDKTAAAFLTSLEQHAFPHIGDSRVDAIDAQDVLAALSPIWTKHPSIAVKVRHRIGLVLDFSQAKRWRSESAPRESLSALLPKRPEGGSFNSMPYPETPPYVAKLQAANPTIGRKALLFTIFTAARSGEVRELQWKHLDLGAAEWNRPAELMRKNYQAHIVTLNAQAIAILEALKPIGEVDPEAFVFPNAKGKPLSDMTLSKIVRPTGFHVHGFRSTFKTWAVEQMPAIPEAVSEAALAHVVPDKVERAYNRAKFIEMRRTLLDAWGNFLIGEGK